MQEVQEMDDSVKTALIKCHWLKSMILSRRPRKSPHPAPILPPRRPYITAQRQKGLFCNGGTAALEAGDVGSNFLCQFAF